MIGFFVALIAAIYPIDNVRGCGSDGYAVPGGVWSAWTSTLASCLEPHWVHRWLTWAPTAANETEVRVASYQLDSDYDVASTGKHIAVEIHHMIHGAGASTDDRALTAVVRVQNPDADVPIAAGNVLGVVTDYGHVDTAYGDHVYLSALADTSMDVAYGVRTDAGGDGTIGEVYGAYTHFYGGVQHAYPLAWDDADHTVKVTTDLREYDPANPPNRTPAWYVGVEVDGDVYWLPLFEIP